MKYISFLLLLLVSLKTELYANRLQDITKTGYQNYRQSQKANEEDSGILKGAKLSYRPPRWQDYIYEGGERSPIYQASGGTDYLGNSIWDPEGPISQSDWEAMQENPNDLRNDNRMNSWTIGILIVLGALFFIGIGMAMNK